MTDEEKLEEAKVLDLWFREVYEFVFVFHDIFDGGYACSHLKSKPVVFCLDSVQFVDDLFGPLVVDDSCYSCGSDGVVVEFDLFELGVVAAVTQHLYTLVSDLIVFLVK